MHDLKLLFVEDNADDIELMKREFKKQGVQVLVTVVTEKEEFERQISNDKNIDAVICDYRLPRFNAIEALKIFNSLEKDIPFVIVSGSIEEELAIKCMREGASDYLLKDRITRLPEAIRQAMEKVALKRKEKEARERAERLFEEVQIASRMKDEFLATLSHELRTHLAVIMGWAELLKNGETGAMSSSSAIDIIYKNSKEQLRIVDEVLDMSQLIFNRLQLNLQETDVSQLIYRLVDSMSAEAEKRNVKIDVKIDQSVSRVVCDKVRFEQILRSLVANGIKFNHLGGKVQISADTEGGQLVVSVADEGEGIEKKFIPYIFERFRQEDTSNTRKHGGLGLGLSVARSLVNLHQGEIVAISQGKGAGAEFILRIPISGPKPIPLESGDVLRQRITI